MLLAVRRACIVLLLAPATLAAESARAEPSVAMAFIRVVGDVSIEFTHVWRAPFMREGVEIGTGSGFVVSPSGLIITNRHVVDEEPFLRIIDGEEARITIQTRRIDVIVGGAGAQRSFDGRLLASDAELDLAVVQVNASELAYIPFGDSDALEPGRALRVFGFPFGRQVEVGKSDEASAIPAVSISAGSLSAARTDDAGATRYLQTDALIQPGNSGGPMVDEDGYAIGVVRMKLSQSATSAGAGFGIPINLVKDFLDAQGLISQLPVTRMRSLARFSLAWKGLRGELPDGFGDRGPGRLAVDGGESEDGVSFWAGRAATPRTAAEIEPLLLAGRAFPELAPGRATTRRRIARESTAHIHGSAAGTTAAGRVFRVEYTLVGMPGEAVAARFVGPPDAIAFNLSLLQKSLQSLVAEPLLTAPVQAPLDAAFEPLDLAGRAAGKVAMPLHWSVEPAVASACSKLPAATAGLAASPPGDFTIVLRALLYSGTSGVEAGMRACGAASGPDYARRSRLGIALAAGGTLVRLGDDVLLLEYDAPESKLPFVSALYAKWLDEAARRAQSREP